MTTSVAGGAVSVLGTLADGVVADGRAGGLVRVGAAGIEIDWFVGADDGWHRAADRGRTVRAGIAPATETRLRVPGGEVVASSYAVAAGRDPAVVVELENASGGPVVVAWVARAAPGRRVRRAEAAGSSLCLDGRTRIDFVRAPARWAVAPRVSGTWDVVVNGDASVGDFARVGNRHDDLEVAVLVVVAHRTRTRIAVRSGRAVGRLEPLHLAALPGPGDVERGWGVALARGMHVELPEPVLQAATDAARATLLIGAARATRRDRGLVAAATSWGLADRRAGSATADAPATRGWGALRSDAIGAATDPARAAAWLRDVKGRLLRVERDTVDLLAGFPVEWLGQPLAVHDAVTDLGPVSFALRWHGARPALLWDAPAGLRVRIPDLDPAFAGAGGAGEALLAEVDAHRLLPLSAGTEPPAAGKPVADPESFS